MLSLKTMTAGPMLHTLRFAAPFAMAALCLWALSARVELPTLADLGALLGSLQLWQWVAACTATAVSFLALGRYDSVAHRHLQTGLDGPQARRAGMAAIAFSQMVGFGLFTGAYARWRLLPGLTAMQSAQLTGMVGLTFMAALATISGVTMVLFAPAPWFSWVGALILVTTACATVVSFLAPAVPLGKLHLRWPSLTAMMALSTWALLDVAAAGTALWLLLPAGVEIAWTTLLVVYFIALGAAILSSAPGGTGPLELMVLSLLPGESSTGLLAALLAFRLVYYALPAAFACGLMLMPRQAQDMRAPLSDPDLLGALRKPASALPEKRPRAETGIIRQNGGHVQAFGLNQLAMLDSPQISVAFFDPLSGDPSEIFAPLRHYARQRNTVPCLYKCSRRTAQAARRAGWSVWRIAAEAVVFPTSFSDSGSSHRQLRRKLRHAEKAGLTVHPAPPTLPLNQMQALDQLWQARHGGAHGTTMGRFEPNYLAGQRVFLAWQAGKIIGFVSLHTAADEWCLDLIRICPDAPDGTGHILVRTAIAAAADESIARLSLAAVPDHRWAGRMDPGLRRFKSCFAPLWEGRYMACPSWSEMALALAELVRLVHRPGPVTPADPPYRVEVNSADQENLADDAWTNAEDIAAHANEHSFHNEVEDYAIALKRLP